jgi:NADPH:quinone reductase-like Zn-dependent oxidoreductase
MKAILIEKTGGPDVLQYKTDVPVPEPKDGEVLVKNEVRKQRPEYHQNVLLTY